MEVNFMNPPDNIRRKLAESEAKKNLEVLTVNKDFNDFVSKIREVRDEENKLERDFRRKLQNGIKYIAYRDPRRMRDYENKIIALMAIIVILIILSAMNLPMVLYCFF